MIKNYLILALKVLRRRPFYTFVSLFGISLTLAVLMLVTSLGDALFGSNPPLTDGDRITYLIQHDRIRMNYDTIHTVDTIAMDDGSTRIDSSYTLEEGGQNNASGSVSFHLLDQNLRQLDKIESYTFFSPYTNLNAFTDNGRIGLLAYHVDEGYFDVFDHRPLYGEVLNSADVSGANQVVVMTDRAARDYFGELSDDLIGRELTVGDRTYRLKGIVPKPRSFGRGTLGDIYLPYTLLPAHVLGSREIYGSFTAAFKSTTTDNRPQVEDQLAAIAGAYDMSADPDYDILKFHTGTGTDVLTREIVATNDKQKGRLLFFIPLAILLVLFLVLPLLNLINLGVSRMSERQSEIGVRKAFGAGRGEILWQFVFENIVLTFIGGMIGMVLAVLLIFYLNENNTLGFVGLTLSWRTFLYFFLIILLFGVLSGLVPAYRMSRMNIANALR